MVIIHSLGPKKKTLYRNYARNLPLLHYVFLYAQTVLNISAALIAEVCEVQCPFVCVLTAACLRLGGRLGQYAVAAAAGRMCCSNVP